MDLTIMNDLYKKHGRLLTNEKSYYTADIRKAKISRSNRYKNNKIIKDFSIKNSNKKVDKKA